MVELMYVDMSKPFIAAKNIMSAGKVYAPGDIFPIENLDPKRVEQLLRTRKIRQDAGIDMKPRPSLPLVPAEKGPVVMTVMEVNEQNQVVLEVTEETPVMAKAKKKAPAKPKADDKKKAPTKKSGGKKKK